MCGRFFVDPDDMSDAELIALLNREKEKVEDARDALLAFGEVKPGDCAAVIALNRKSKRSAFVMQWGYHVNRKLLFNARSETAAEKPTFCQSMQDRRCLIPASAYFEWDHREKTPQKYRFFAPERRTIYLAGLYRFEADHPLPVFTILTRAAAPEIACFHDRMPVIIPDHLKGDWLDRSQSGTEMLRAAVTDVTWAKAY